MNQKSHFLRDPSGQIVSEIFDHELFAIRNLAKGEANADQQRKAYRVIVEKIASSDDLSYRAEKEGGERVTNFHEGRRYVGLQVRKLANAPVNLLIDMENKEWQTTTPQQPAASNSPVKRRRGRPPKPR